GDSDTGSGGNGSARTATVPILVNAPVTANPDSYTVPQGSSSNALSVLSNDTDADGDPLTISATTAPAHGSATVSGGQVLYTPAPIGRAPDSVSYTTSQGTGGSH